MKTLGTMITGIMTKSLKKKGSDTTLMDITNHWSNIVGIELAQGSTPLRLNKGVLIIKAPSGAALELAHQSDKIIAAVNELLTYDAVERIKFMQ